MLRKRVYLNHYAFKMQLEHRVIYPRQFTYTAAFEPVYMIINYSNWLLILKIRMRVLQLYIRIDLHFGTIVRERN